MYCQTVAKLTQNSGLHVLQVYIIRIFIIFDLHLLTLTSEYGLVFIISSIKLHVENNEFFFHVRNHPA